MRLVVLVIGALRLRLQKRTEVLLRSTLLKKQAVLRPSCSIKKVQCQ